MVIHNNDNTKQMVITSNNSMPVNFEIYRSGGEDIYPKHAIGLKINGVTYFNSSSNYLGLDGDNKEEDLIKKLKTCISSIVEILNSGRKHHAVHVWLQSNGIFDIRGWDGDN